MVKVDCMAAVQADGESRRNVRVIYASLGPPVDWLRTAWAVVYSWETKRKPGRSACSRANARCKAQQEWWNSASSESFTPRGE